MSNIVPMTDHPTGKRQPTGRLAIQLGKLFTAARERSGQSRYAFASTIPGRKLGVKPGESLNPNTVRDIEMGLGNPTLAKIEEWCALYGVEIDLVLRARGRTTSRTYTAKDVRAWCQQTGRPVSPHGRLSEATLAAYEAAHQAQERNSA